MLVAAAPAVAGLAYPDIPPHDDSDLRVPVVEVPQTENAYFFILENNIDKAIDATYYTPQLSALLAGEMWDAVFAEQAVASNTIAILTFRTASQQRVYQNPLAADPDKVAQQHDSLPPLGGLRKAAAFSNLSALLLARSGLGVGAELGLAQAMMSVELGSKMQRAQNFLLEWLVGHAIKKQGLETVRLIVASSTLRAEYKDPLAAWLEEHRNDGSGLAMAHRIEYAALLEVVNSLDLAEVSPMFFSVYDFYYHPNETRKYIAEMMRGRVASATAACDMAGTSTELFDSEPADMWKLIFTPNSIGETIVERMSHTDDTKKRACIENSLIDSILAQL